MQVIGFNAGSKGQTAVAAQLKSVNEVPPWAYKDGIRTLPAVKR